MQTWDECGAIVPCWNYGVFLGDALDSIRVQTLRPARVVVIDDASTDDTQDVLRDFPWVECIRHPIRLGVAMAMNHGVEVLKEMKWIAQLSADDMWEPRLLEFTRDAVSGYCSDRPLGSVYHRCEYIDADGQWIGRLAAVRWEPGLIREREFINGGALMLRAGWERVGGYRQEPNEDWHLWRRFDEAGYGSAYVDGAALLYRQHRLGHRNYGTDEARDVDWGGRSVNLDIHNQALPPRGADV